VDSLRQKLGLFRANAYLIIYGFMRKRFFNGKVCLIFEDIATYKNLFLEK